MGCLFLGSVQSIQDWNFGLEYEKYLKEVVSILESDPEFRKKLETGKPEDVYDGTIAKQVEYLSHGVRTRLDEAKRQEMERLRYWINTQLQRSSQYKGKQFKDLDSQLKLTIIQSTHQHMDTKSAYFDSEDLQKLISKSRSDVEQTDKLRREQFKMYEMEKRYEKEMRLKAINDTAERKVVQEEMERLDAKHNQHDKLKHPMSKDQLEGVWKEQDHMDPRDFNPRTFFMYHDLDSNGLWDENEVRIIFKNELDKAYDPKVPEDDMKERVEEMERMREHVFQEMDKNKDKMISFEEFHAATQTKTYSQDQGWKTLDEDGEMYTEEEYQKFIYQRQLEDQKMMEDGKMPQDYQYANILAMPPVGYPHGHNGQPIPDVPSHEHHDSGFNSSSKQPEQQQVFPGDSVKEGKVPKSK